MFNLLLKSHGLSAKIQINKSSAVVQQGYYAVGLMITKVISFFLLPYLASQLGLIEFARLETLLAIINGATIVVSLGMVNILYRKVGKSRSKAASHRIAAQLAGNAILIALFITLLGVITTPIHHPIISSIVHVSVIELWLCIALISTEGILGVSLAWLRMKEQAALFFQMMMMRALLYTAFVFIFLTHDLGLTWILVASLLAVLYQVFHLIYFQRKDTGLLFSLSSLRKTAFYGWPFVISGLAMYATQGMEVVLLAQKINPELLSSYVIAIKFFLIAALINQPFLLWWYPKRMQVIHQEKGSIKAGVGATLGVFIACFSSVIIWLWAPILIDFLFEDGIAPAKSFLPWLLIAGVLKQWGALYNLGCFSSENNRNQMYIELCTGGGCLVAFPIAIHFAGIYGALGVFILSQAGRLLAYWVISQRQYYVIYPIRLLLTGCVICLSAITLGLLGTRYLAEWHSLAPFILSLLLSAILVFGLVVLGRIGHAITQ
ncbi:lipopolysaccharide biosynthesis protein [Marinomonas algicola]|uniref:lipopolysaccharide biosynthesis protein n=1 Tax=Marinomonas algicola TaxID=2773454 RepID=UPI00174BD625|nr:oligosaccharide flippase family protein [Marinomonas algicola]